MNTELANVAIDCVRRGWSVFPCRARTKEPAVKGGFYAASKDEAKVREWWSRWPDANVGIATGASGLCVLDIDHGVPSAAELASFMERAGLPQTYGVRTGRRDGFGVQLYYHGDGLRSAPWKDPEDPNVSGDIRCGTGYVLAAGSIHPSGEPYRELREGFDPRPVPPYVQRVATASREAMADEDDGGPITEWRNDKLTRIAGRMRNAGMSASDLLEYLQKQNAQRCQPPLPDEEVERIARNAANWKVPAEEPQILLGGKLAGAAGVAEVPESKPPVDWRTRYHTRHEAENAPPVGFLIDGFLSCDSITALAAPVAQRKSIVAMNVAHALVTGEPLFGYFRVVQKPTRVIYLVPEMGLRSFADRLKKIGLMPYVGETFFFRTMSMEGDIDLDELTAEELDGAVIIIDTAVRFIKGSENDSADMRVFAQTCFRLKQLCGINAAVFVLFHSVKGSKQDSGLSLEGALRGSGELGAFITSCWATRLQDPDPAKSHTTESYITNVKQRDFESKPFEAVSGPDFKMRIVGEPGEIRLRATEFKKAPPDAVADAIIRGNPTLGVEKLRKLMSDKGSKHGKDWILNRKKELKAPGADGVVVTEG